jgi:O-antigen ligase
MTGREGEPRHARGVADTVSRYEPSLLLECGYYAQVFYSIMGPAIGLSFDFIGALMLATLGGLVAMGLGRHLGVILRSLAAPLACGVAFVGVQVLAHGESLRGSPYLRDFIPWMVGLVVIQCLALRRGFLQRFAIVVVLIGILTLPFLRSFVNDASRMGLSRGITIGNPNDLGAWFGFCCVYLTILGLETRRLWLRATSWSLAVGALLVVGLTVSRAPMFAAACSIVVAFQRVLKRGFVPFLAMIAMAWIAFELGLFERSVAMYSQRGLEETGRLLVWPLAIEHILQFPMTGVGVAHTEVYIPGRDIAITPHNGAIFIGLASGIVPLLFFVAYWVKAFVTTFSAGARSQEETPFQTPLLVYSFLIVMNLNQGFTAPWVMVTLATITATGFAVEARKAIAGSPDRRAGVTRRNLATFATRTIR